jgi:uncharacterized membrane protein
MNASVIVPIQRYFPLRGGSMVIGPLPSSFGTACSATIGSLNVAKIVWL